MGESETARPCSGLAIGGDGEANGEARSAPRLIGQRGVARMACHAIAGPLRARRLAQALATRTVEAARLLALLGLATVVFFQSALAQGQRDPTAIARQPSPQQSVP